MEQFKIWLLFPDTLILLSCNIKQLFVSVVFSDISKLSYFAAFLLPNQRILAAISFLQLTFYHTFRPFYFSLLALEEL